jgi:Tfp pilus assembly protein PilW
MTRMIDARGFSLMELIWAMALGMIVLLAGFTVIDRAFIGNKAIADRQDGLQRGRNALELMTRQLRSEVCLQTSPVTMPLADAQNQTATFYTYLGDPTSATRDPSTGQPYPEQHILTWSPNTAGSSIGKITETDAKVTSFNPLTVASPYRTTVLVSNVVLPNSKLFQYSADNIESTQLSAPLDAATRATVDEVSVAFKVLPAGISDINNQQATTFQDYVFWRSIDPVDSSEQPCDNG